MKKLYFLTLFFINISLIAQDNSIDQLISSGEYKKVLNLTENYLESNNATKQRLNALIWLSRKEAGRANYKKSIVYMKEILLMAKKSFLVKKIISGWMLDDELNIIRKMENINNNKAFKHKLLVIFIKQSKSKFYLDRNNNQKYFEKNLDKEVYEKTKLFFNYQKKFVDVFSNGGITVDIDYMKSNCILKGAQTNPYGALNEIDLTKIEPQSEIRKLLYKKLPQYDTFVFIWPKPYKVKTTAYGGKGLLNQLVPYQLFGVSRGFFVIPGSWMKSMYTRITFIHEFFHTMEYNLGFGPPHAWFKKRTKKYPQYAGLSEYQYYQKRFDDTIKFFGWENINWKKRFPLKVPKKIFHKNLKILLSEGVERLRNANEIYKQGKKEFNSKNYLKARKMLNKALKINSYHSYALYKLAQINYYEKKYGETIKLCEKIIKVDPDTPEIYILMARAAREKEDYEKVVHYLALGFKDNPKNFSFRIKAYENMRLVLSRARRKKMNMLKLINRFLKMDESAEIYRIRGTYYLNKNKLKESIQDYKKAIQLEPLDPENRVALGKALWYDRKYKSAKKEFSKALKNSRYYIKKISNHFVTAVNYERKRHLKKELLKLAMQYDEHNPRVYLGIGNFYRYKNKSKAIKYYEIAADLGSKYALRILKKKFNINYTLKSIPVKNAKVKIAVYDVYGFEDVSHIKNIFYGYKEYKIETIRSKDIIQGKLKKYDVLIVPGGNPKDYGNPLGRKGLKNIQEFIKKGGKYIGICAGAYFGIAKKFLHLFNGEAFNRRYWFRGMGNLEVKLTSEGKKVFGDMKKPIILRYANGTMMQRLKLPGRPKYKVLGIFKTGFANNGVPDIMVGRHAIITASYGKGKALIFSPHPEYSRGRSYMVRKAVDFLMRK